MTGHARYDVRLASIPVPTLPVVREALAQRWLAPREQSLLSRRAVEKRRNEFVAGRIAAKTAAARLRGMPLTRDVAHTIVEEGETAGQPIAVDPSGIRIQAVHLSITHSQGVAIAAAATEPIGIDLAPVAEYTRSFEEAAFLDGELDCWDQVLGGSKSEPVRAVGFAAKEAALKWLGVGLRAGLHEVRVSPTALTEPSACVDLAVSTRGLTARVQCRLPDRRAGGLAWWSVELHGAVGELGEQVLVILGGRRSTCRVE